MSKQYDMAANGWEYVEHYFGPFWKKSDRTIHQAAPGSQWELMEGSKTIATMAHDSIDPVGALARIADERELRAKHEEFWAGEKDRIDAVIGKPANWQPGPHPFKDEPCGFNAAMDRKNAIAERSAAALESIAASLAKMATAHEPCAVKDDRKPDPISKEELRAWAKMKGIAPEEPNAWPEGTVKTESEIRSELAAWKEEVDLHPMGRGTKTVMG